MNLTQAQRLKGEQAVTRHRRTDWHTVEQPSEVAPRRSIKAFHTNGGSRYKLKREQVLKTSIAKSKP